MSLTALAFRFVEITPVLVQTALAYVVPVVAAVYKAAAVALTGSVLAKPLMLFDAPLTVGELLCVKAALAAVTIAPEGNPVRGNLA